MRVKWEFFKEIYPQESETVFASDDYKTFFEANKRMVEFRIRFFRIYAICTERPVWEMGKLQSFIIKRR